MTRVSTAAGRKPTDNDPAFPHPGAPGPEGAPTVCDTDRHRRACSLSEGSARTRCGRCRMGRVKAWSQRAGDVGSGVAKDPVHLGAAGKLARTRSSTAGSASATSADHSTPKTSTDRQWGVRGVCSCASGGVCGGRQARVRSARDAYRESSPRRGIPDRRGPVAGCPGRRRIRNPTVGCGGRQVRVRTAVQTAD